MQCSAGDCTQCSLRCFYCSCSPLSPLATSNPGTWNWTINGLLKIYNDDEAKTTLVMIMIGLSFSQIRCSRVLSMLKRCSKWIEKIDLTSMATHMLHGELILEYVVWPKASTLVFDSFSNELDIKNTLRGNISNKGRCVFLCVAGKNDWSCQFLAHFQYSVKDNRSKTQISR